jgi:hypothetical protein
MGFTPQTPRQGISMERISDKWAILLFVVIWAAVIAVADMNWPSHMGPSNVLIDGLASLIPGR